MLSIKFFEMDSEMEQKSNGRSLLQGRRVSARMRSISYGGIQKHLLPRLCRGKLKLNSHIRYDGTETSLTIPTL